MQKYFITYGDNKYKQSLQRIATEANNLNLFDKIICYTPANLGDDILNSPLMQYEQGGGYWAWKPYVIELTLQKMQDGDLLVYCDTGCTLALSHEWNLFFNKLNHYNALFFLLHNKVECWSKQNVIKHYEHLVPYFHQFYQVAATAFIIKKMPQIVSLITEWKNLMLTRPDLVLNVPDEERQFESKRFIENRHDQSVLTGLVYQYEKQAKIVLQWENIENSSFTKRAIVASRISDKTSRSPINANTYIKYYIKKILNILYFSPIQRYWYKRNQKYNNGK
jgi:hypothetical protein